MIFDRKQPPALELAPVGEKPPEPLPDHNIELRAEWDDEKADWEYRLYRVMHPRTVISGGWIGEMPQPKAGEWIWAKTSGGDKAWADRQAEHYGVEIIYPDKEAQS